ncbi:MAG: dienelactone hydrolase family protein, partial [Myxococcales bacterium]|nr:dienelactone hydrolase family protein [Myxococcales bacterium]
SALTPLGAEIYIPTTYNPGQLASPVIWLFNETLDQWTGATQADAAILVDLHEYNDTQKIVAKLNETLDILDVQYNVDRGRYYWAGWSAGGNLVILIGTQNQDTLAGTMVFPGTGGQQAQQAIAAWQGHKLRMYYACGEADPNFDHNAVQFEADTWKNQYGYTTRFDLVPGAPHYLDETTYKVRDAAWQWMRGFNLKN